MCARRGAGTVHARSGAFARADVSSRRTARGPVCANCRNDNPRLWETDYKNGNYVCLACGAVDANRVLSTEEESRVFADDSAADKEQKKRAEFRADGRLGSFIAGAVERRGQLPNPAIQSLQRAQLRVQDAPAELLAAAEQLGKTDGAPPAARSRKPVKASKQLERYLAAIDSLGEKARVGGAISGEAKQLAERWAAQLDEHDGRCRAEGCRMRKATGPHAASAAAAAFLLVASKRSADAGGGEGVARAMQEFDVHLQDKEASAFRRFHPLLVHALKWRKADGCVNSDAAPLAQPAPSSVGVAPAAKGLVSRVAERVCGGGDKLRATLQIKQHAFGLLDWIASESLLVGKQPKTVAAAALMLAFDELVRARAPVMGDVEPPTLHGVCDELATTPATVQQAIDAIKAPRDAFVRAGL